MNALWTTTSISHLNVCDQENASTCEIVLITNSVLIPLVFVILLKQKCTSQGPLPYLVQVFHTYAPIACLLNSGHIMYLWGGYETQWKRIILTVAMCIKVLASEISLSLFWEIVLNAFCIAKESKHQAQMVKKICFLSAIVLVSMVITAQLIERTLPEILAFCILLIQLPLILGLTWYYIIVIILKRQKLTRNMDKYIVHTNQNEGKSNSNRKMFIILGVVTIITPLIFTALLTTVIKIVKIGPILPNRVQIQMNAGHILLIILPIWILLFYCVWMGSNKMEDMRKTEAIHPTPSPRNKQSKSSPCSRQPQSRQGPHLDPLDEREGQELTVPPSPFQEQNATNKLVIELDETEKDAVKHLANNSMDLSVTVLITNESSASRGEI